LSSPATHGFHCFVDEAICVGAGRFDHLAIRSDCEQAVDAGADLVKLQAPPRKPFVFHTSELAGDVADQFQRDGVNRYAAAQEQSSQRLAFDPGAECRGPKLVIANRMRCNGCVVQPYSELGPSRAFAGELPLRCLSL
jgi:hypothetical protein